MNVEQRTPADSRVTLTQLMGPGSANTLGNIHGGYIMKLCDEAGGMAASKYARRHAVTVVVDSMVFLSPVNIGDLVTVAAEVSWTGRTSMETRVVVTAEDVISGEITHTNTAYFVYVAIDSRGRSTPVPPLYCATKEEKQRFERAAERQAHRLNLREEMAE
jgi:acyl-CoA hydrolase